MVNLVAFWRFLHPDVYAGQMFVLIVMTVMALEIMKERASLEAEAADSAA
jgi:NADH:ubiquinone oxidoreductase subunit K